MFLRRLVICGLVAMMIFAVAGCSKTSKEPGRYYNKAERFSIRFPTGWNKIEPLDEAVISVQNPEKTVVISIYVEKTPAGYTLAQGMQHIYSRAEARDIFYSERGDTSIDGVEAHWLNGLSGDQKFTYLLYFVIKSDRLYSVQFVAPVDKFADYKDEFDKIAQSFKFE